MFTKGHSMLKLILFLFQSILLWLSLMLVHHSSFAQESVLTDAPSENLSPKKKPPLSLQKDSKNRELLLSLLSNHIRRKAKYRRYLAYGSLATGLGIMSATASYQQSHQDPYFPGDILNFTGFGLSFYGGMLLTSNIWDMQYKEAIYDLKAGSSIAAIESFLKKKHDRALLFRRISYTLWYLSGIVIWFSGNAPLSILCSTIATYTLIKKTHEEKMWEIYNRYTTTSKTAGIKPSKRAIQTQFTISLVPSSILQLNGQF